MPRYALLPLPIWPPLVCYPRDVYYTKGWLGQAAFKRKKNLYELVLGFLLCYIANKTFLQYKMANLVQNTP